MVNPLKLALLGATHPSELRALVTYKVWHDARELAKDPETGYQRAEMKRCWEFLDMTSRSFAAVIKELEGELCRVVCLFYLVLRGLDTVEDDMSIELEEKCQVLESFHEKLSTPGWTYNGCGSREKDRQLLVEFDVVITEMMLLDERYTSVITRICKAMGYGMAHYARAGASSNSTYAVDTLADFDLYCHYVAGLVGEGLSGLFSASGKEDEDLGNMLTLSNSMGLMLQKTNIMRDFREDLDDGRFFWPRDIWGKYTTNPKDFYERAETDPEMRQKALWALSEMVLDTLTHATDGLDYLSLLKNQSIFNFCAIPQVMSIATLEICFMNPKVFTSNVKIRKSLALLLIQRATNPKDVAGIYLTYARKIRARVQPSDPSFIKINVVCGRIEQWLENRYPGWVFENPGGLAALPFYRDQPAAAQITDARVRQLPLSSQGEHLRKLKGSTAGMRKLEETSLSTSDIWMLLLFVTGMMVFIVLMIAAVFGAIYYFTADAETSQGIKQFMNSMFRVPFEALTEKVHQLMGQAAAPAQRVEL